VKLCPCCGSPGLRLRAWAVLLTLLVLAVLVNIVARWSGACAVPSRTCAREGVREGTAQAPDQRANDSGLTVQQRGGRNPASLLYSLFFLGSHAMRG